MQLQVMQPGAIKTRKPRTPNFPCAGVMKPFGLYPIFAHPMLPNETVQSLKLKWRVLSKPVVHPLVGSWLETWFVYVKFTDLDRDLGQMFISETYPTTGYLAAGASDRYFTNANQIDWIKLCAERFHESYFLDDSETPRSIDGVRKVKGQFHSWYQNCMFKPADDALDVTDIHDAKHEWDAYMMMQQMNMSELSYESYLEQFGVRNLRSEEGQPEILRYARSWTQPVNTVEPSDGSPSSAWVWSEEVVLDKPKKFKEPGFLLAFACVRPKFFQENQRYSFVGNLWGYQDWYPVYNLEDPTAGIRSLQTDDKVFAAGYRADTGEQELLYDHRDLLSHGEQFVNKFYSLPHALPLSNGMTGEDADDNQNLRGEYVDETSIDACFVSASADDKYCFYEGIGRAQISGHIVDTTPGGR